MAQDQHHSGSSNQNWNRRQFLKTAGAGAGAAMFHIVPAHVLGGTHGIAPSEQIRLGAIGVGGPRSRGSVDLKRLSRESGVQVAAVCDVDEKHVAKAKSRYPKAKTFVDFYELYEQLGDELDAMLVATPDHTHAIAAMEGLRQGKHVYCEKPLARSVEEVNALEQAAKQAGVVTQLGNQGHSSPRIRMLCEWVWDGAIGEVNEVHAWCGAFKNVYCNTERVREAYKGRAVPEHLHYDKWVGPAQYLPYGEEWVHWDWRGWSPYGCGTLGDWWCHVMDPSYWALNLDYPETVKAEVIGYDPDEHKLTFPKASKITFQFPANNERGPVKVVWFDGHFDQFPEGEGRPRPNIADDRNMPGTGAVLYGQDGAIMHGSHGAGGARLVPESAMQKYAPNMPEKSIPRAPGNNHHRDFVQAIREGRHAGSDFFQFGGPLTECSLLGVAALRFPGQELKYDAKAKRFTNNDAANKVLNPPYREGWTLGATSA
jgi:predicted dehydrogenase